MIFIKILIPLYLLTSIAYAGVKDVYEFKWLDPKKKVFVLQNKIHRNKGHSNVALGFGESLLSDFQDTMAIHLMVDYYFDEEWGLEFFYTSYSNSNNSSYDAVQADTAGSVIPHIVRFNSIYGLNLMFSPFYGKINTFNTIFYVDWNFGVGLAMADSEDNDTSFDNKLANDFFESSSRVGASAKTQVRWHLSEAIKIQLDYIFYFTRLPEPNSTGLAVKRSRDFIISLGYKF